MYETTYGAEELLSNNAVEPLDRSTPYPVCQLPARVQTAWNGTTNTTKRSTGRSPGAIRNQRQMSLWPKATCCFWFSLDSAQVFCWPMSSGWHCTCPLSMRKRDQSAGAGGHTVVALAVTEKRPTAVELQQCNTMHLYISVNKITYMGGPLGHYLHTQWFGNHLLLHDLETMPNAKKQKTNTYCLCIYIYMFK